MEQYSLFGEDPIEKKAQAVKRIKVLRKEIKGHNLLYYEKDAPVISDLEYDKLMQELKELESQYPDLITKSSPTQKVGGRTKSIFTEVVHEVVMQSLQDVFTMDDVIEFVRKIKEEYGENTEFVVENKIDGVSVSLEYENGKFVRGSTRGDGLVGEDVTFNLNCIDSIPKELTTNDTIEVRGEVFLPRKQFNRLNEELEAQSKKLFANPRNAAAGTLRQLDTELVTYRKLDIFIFNVQRCTTKKFKSHSQSVAYCSSLGLHTIEFEKVCRTEQEIINAIEEIGSKRDTLEYDIDGAVVKVNDLILRNTLGSTVKVPKWAVAYKYPPEQKETKILDITFGVGRTGKITPLAILTPVRVSGSTIAKATLHNFDYIKLKDIRIGDSCMIQKAGDVIPEVDRVLIEKRDGSQRQVQIPTHCPVCGEPVEKETDTVDVKCVNNQCPALVYKRIVHFASRECMDIEGFGEIIIEKLMDCGKIEDIADIYDIGYLDLMELEGVKEKTASSLMKAIEKSKSNSLDKLLFGLSIPNVGKKAASILMQQFKNMDEMMDADKEYLSSISEIGGITAEGIKQYFEKPEHIELIARLKKAGLNLNGGKKELLSTKLEGLSFAITGSFDRYPREDIIDLINQHGGSYQTTVSKKTSYMIAGQEGGNKLIKAEKLGVEVVDLNYFLSLIK